MSDTTTPSGYLDTNIVGAITTTDLPEAEQRALDTLLDLYDEGAIRLVTSTVTREEIDRIPAEHRLPHLAELERIRALPTIAEYRASMLAMMGVGGPSGPPPLLASLQTILDEDDARHVFQAISNGISDFITADRRTILSRREHLTPLGSNALWPTEAVDRIVRDR